MAGSMTEGSVTAGSATAGSVRAGSVTVGSVTTGSVTTGSVTTGSVTTGSSHRRNFGAQFFNRKRLLDVDQDRKIIVVGTDGVGEDAGRRRVPVLLWRVAVA